MNPQAAHWITLIQMYTRKQIIRAIPSLQGQHVHLWNTYKQGRKPTSGTWLVRYHWIIRTPDSEREILQIQQVPYAPITRIRSQVCSFTEYEAYLASLNTKVAKAA